MMNEEVVIDFDDLEGTNSSPKRSKMETLKEFRERVFNERSEFLKKMEDRFIWGNPQYDIRSDFDKMDSSYDILLQGIEDLLKGKTDEDLSGSSHEDSISSIDVWKLYNFYDYLEIEKQVMKQRHGF